MRAVLQRVSQGAVYVESNQLGAIDSGFVILLGIQKKDTKEDADQLAQQIAHLRVFENEEGRFDKSLLDVGGAALVIPQFTLLADTSHGRRPSFFEAAPPDVAEPLVDVFAQALRDVGVHKVAQGRFGSHMQVEIHNDGPVTIILDTRE